MLGAKRIDSSFSEYTTLAPWAAECVITRLSRPLLTLKGSESSSLKLLRLVGNQFREPQF